MKPLNFNKIASQLMFIWLPCVAASLYWGMVASDRFVSESKFVIQNAGAEQPASLDVSSIISGGGLSNQDSYMIHEYILSWDMLSILDKNLKLRQHFTSESIDPLSRLSEQAPREEFLEYYKKRIHVDFDEISSITTVTAQGFKPKMAQEIVQTIVQESEKFTNRIGHKVASEQMNFISGQLDRAQIKVKTDKRKIIAFQNNNRTFSPEIETQSISTLVSSLDAEISAKTAKRKALLTYLNDNAPEIKQLSAEISSLRQQSHAEKSKMVGKGKKPALNNLSAEFQELETNLEFGADMYRSTLAALESARIDAARKLKHLILLQHARLPETAEYPRRLYNIITFIAITLMVFWIGKLAIATVRDHKD
ncbi:MAG TPA: hypothetical protein DD827_04840 [Gammaproteobacteria bacterium]|nr:hypothetical protein [Gammaproteobacteria bacterium]